MTTVLILGWVLLIGVAYFSSVMVLQKADKL